MNSMSSAKKANENSIHNLRHLNQQTSSPDRLPLRKHTKSLPTFHPNQVIHRLFVSESSSEMSFHDMDEIGHIRSGIVIICELYQLIRWISLRMHSKQRQPLTELPAQNDDQVLEPVEDMAASRVQLTTKCNSIPTPQIAERCSHSSKHARLEAVKQNSADGQFVDDIPQKHVHLESSTLAHEVDLMLPSGSSSYTSSSGSADDNNNCIHPDRGRKSILRKRRNSELG